MKICTACKTEKERDCFYSDKSKSDSLSTRCKDCVKAAQSTPEVRARQNALRREYYAKDKDRFIQRNEVWRKKNQGKVNAATKRWVERNSEKRKEIANRYAANNPEKRKAASAEYYQRERERINKRNRKYEKKNPELRRELTRRWQAKNKDKLAANCGKRRGRKLQATPEWANEFFMSEAYHLAKLRRQHVGGEWHVDHVVPLRSRFVCGLHTHTNLQVIPGLINMSKSNRHWPDMPE